MTRLETIREKAWALRRQWTFESPAFHIRTGWTDNYDNLLDNVFDRECNEREILDIARGTGRAIVSGRGGSGKTEMLRRIYGHALDSGTIPIYVDLKEWVAQDYEDWSAWTRDDPRDGAAFLFTKFGKLEMGPLDLDCLDPGIEKVVIVDGLNEISRSVGGEILVVLDEIVRNQMRTSVIVADRLVRRELPNATRWKIGTTLPLSEAEVRKHLRLGKEVRLADHDIRMSPFFLDAQLKDADRSEKTGRAAAIEQSLRAHSSLHHDELIDAARAAYRMYTDRQSRSRVFPTQSFLDGASATTFRKLEGSGALVSKNGESLFNHHLVHDFLVSYHLARLNPSHWNPETFRAVTFDGSSFDVLEFAFEQLAKDGAERFLRALYDWNLYAAGYVLGHVANAQKLAGNEICVVLSAMLAEKRFDAILATRERAEDALRLISTEEVRAFRRATSIAQICDLLVPIDSQESWFRDWRDLYCLSQNRGELTPHDLAAIENPDSIMGWTMANVARRFTNMDWAAAHLVRLLDAAKTATVRWRAVHLLGKIPSSDAITSLIGVLEKDADIDVRFGAVRSIIEVSLATDPDARANVAEMLERLAPLIAAQDRLARELRACLLADPSAAPTNWLDFVARCVRAQFRSVEKTSEQDAWRGCLIAAEALYATRKPQTAASAA